MNTGALNDIKVIDLTRVLAGPYCTMILGDLGAEVIKVEGPGGSDDTRQWGPPYAEGESAYYLCANRNKKAITLNLKSPEGQEILKKLIADSDVIIHNFKTGTMEKWGLAYNDLKKINDQIIYCGISGFGQTGPYKNDPGYDFVIQAMSGLMSITGTKSTGPLKVGVAITDVLTGLYSNIAIQAAIHHRERTGMGQAIDLSLYDSAISAMINVASNYLISGKTPEPLGNKHPNIVPYQSFSASDGDIAVGVGNDRQFRQLCHVIGKPELADDDRFMTNSARLEHHTEIEHILDEIFSQNTKEAWLSAMKSVGIPSGPIQSMDEVFNDPQVSDREMKVEMNHPKIGELAMVGSPLKLSETPPTYREHPPLVGEHTDEIMKTLGYSQSTINELRNNRII